MNMSYIRIHLLTLRNYCKNIVLKFLDKPWGHCLKLHEGALRYLGFLESIRSNRWAELFQMLTRVVDPAGSCSDPRGHSGEGDSRERPDILYD